jgi:hypothetical protein
MVATAKRHNEVKTLGSLVHASFCTVEAVRRDGDSGFFVRCKTLGDQDADGLTVHMSEKRALELGIHPTAH